uniref:DUF7597 domain-containing protein n=1 Tax=Setaria italica TaxID=4555 RepID=K3ZE06_SETIT
MALMHHLNLMHGVRHIRKKKIPSTPSSPGGPFRPPISSPSASSREFWLVCSFGRSAIHLNVDSISLILQSVLGGSAEEFCAQHLSDWMFLFYVNSRHVGLMIYLLKTFSDYSLWCEEEEANCTHISHKSRKKSYADAIKHKPNLPQFPCSMANFPMDPRPFVPEGFALVQCEVVRESVHPRSFLVISIDKTNEDLAITIIVSPVAKEDLTPFARELCHFLMDRHVRAPEIQQCAIGEAYVCFDSPMQREGFMNGASLSFGDYQLRFNSHDEGMNFRDLDLDWVVWLLLLCFPPDAKRLINLIAKSIAGFAQLLHVHSSSSMSRLVIKALVNKDNDVPESVTVAVGSPPQVRTWTMLIFLLSASDIVLGGDEDPLPVDGPPIHSMPHPAPGWMGPQIIRDGAGSVVDEGSGNDGSGDHARASGGVKSPSQHHVLGSSSTLNQVLSFFSPPQPFANSYSYFALSQFIVDLSVKVLSYISNEPTLWFLAKVVVGLDEQDAPGGTDVAMEDDYEVKIISKEEVIVKNPRNHRAKKMKALLDEKFLRRSKHLNQDLDGYRAQAANVEEPSPLAIVPIEETIEEHAMYDGGATSHVASAPFLSVENVQAMATGFLKMQAGSMFAAALLDSSDDEYVGGMP